MTPEEYKNLTKEEFNDLRIALRNTELEDLEDMLESNPNGLVKIRNLIKNSHVLFLELVKPSWNTKTIPDVHTELYAMYDAMDRKEFSILNNVVYRGFGKSGIKKNVTIKDILFRSQKYILYVNETHKQAAKDLESIKYELKTNKIIQFLFGDVSFAYDGKDSYGNDKKSKVQNVNRSIFYLNNDPTQWVGVEIYGMTSPIRGLILNGIRPTRVWLDDFESERNSSTPAGREAIKEKIRNQIFPIGQAGEFDMIFQGTIVHPKAWLAEVKSDFENDVIGAFNNQYSRYFERAMSSDHENYGVGVWEEFHDREYWQQKRTMYLKDNEYWKFLQEYYNIPKQSGSPSFKTDMIKSIDATYRCVGKIQYIEYSDGMKVPCKTYLGMDPAYAFTARADDTVLTAIAMLPDSSVIILDMFVGKVDMSGKIEKLFEFAKMYSPDNIVIEAFGAALELPHAFEKEMWERKERYNYDVFKEKIGKSNKFLNGLSPYVNAGKFFYTNSCQNIDLLKFQMESFSGEERYHDDTIDGLFLAYHTAVAPPRFDVDKKILEYKQRNKPKTRNPYDLAMEALAVRNAGRNNVRDWRM